MKLKLPVLHVGKHRLRLLPLVSIAAFLALLIAAIVVSSITQDHLHLDNGSVWVTSTKDGKVARFNPAIKDVDAALAAKSSDFDVAQSGNTTVFDDQNQAYSIDSATVSIAKHSAKSKTTTAFVSGETSALFDSASGKLWVGSADKLDALSDTSAPRLTLSRGSRIALDSDGRVYVYRSSDAAVLRFDSSADTTATHVANLSTTHNLAAQGFTVIGETPVVLTGNTLRWPGKSVTIKNSKTLTLQDSPADDQQKDSIVVASMSGLNFVSLSSGKITNVLTGSNAIPATPVSLNGCIYAAWATSTKNYIKTCKNSGTAQSVQKVQTLSAVSPTSHLIFRLNHRSVILNDATNGNVWEPSDSTDVIKIEWNKLDTSDSTTKDNTQKSVQNHQDFTEKCSGNDDVIKAADDELGTTAGQHQILDVLRNDQQTSCSVLKIEKVESLDAEVGTVSIIYDGRYLQLALSDKASGDASFTYSITDGRGQSSSATVHLRIESGINHAPAQTDIPPNTAVEQGASVSVNALDSFTDADGDQLALVSANPKNSNDVGLTSRADGQLVFDAGAAQEGRVGVEVSVSDGTHVGTGILYFSVKAPNTLNPVIDPITRTVQPGKSVSVALEQYLHANSTSPLELSAVTPDQTSTASAQDMMINFSSTTPGTHYVTYTVSQGDHSALGMVRFDVAALSNDERTPVASNDVALLNATNTAIVDPLTNDCDPLGGVLAITDVHADSDAGIKMGVVNHQRLYITAQKVPTKPVAITYTIANAEASSTGLITLQPPNLAASTPPTAHNISASVRQNGIVTIDVMDHVSVSDGTDVELSAALGYGLGSFKGLAFISGDTVRYQASSHMGTYPITYTVKDNLGNSSSATITVTVHKKDAATKQKPQPKDAEAQVVAGRSVKIPISLLGIDKDGDDVSLLGLGNSAPEKGRINEVGADYLLYEAYPDSSGTDTFQYAVEDWSGQRATAQIRVGVLASSSDSSVFARDDSLQMRPGREVSVPVSLNDISEDNENLTVKNDVQAQGIDAVSVRNNSLNFVTPNQAGVYYLTYTVANEAGISDTATLSVTVSEDAPISAPTALDDLVPPAQTIDRSTVDVDVRDFISNPSGTLSDLRVGVDDSAADHAHVSSKNSTIISVDLTDEARAVPYTVTNTKYNLTSTAFIQVPAYGVFPPLLRPKAPALSVNAGEELTIRLADYVRVGAGKQPHVQSADQVSATRSDGSVLYKDSETLKFRSAKDYSGPASITFTVSDSDKPGNDTNTATLTLPIKVIGKEAAPPTFSSASLNVVPGEDPQTISLAALTTAPSGFESAKSQYSYSISSGSKSFSTDLTKNGSLRVSAAPDIAPGTTSVITVSVHYDTGKTIKGAINLTASATNRPLARIVERNIDATAGKTSKLNVLAGSYNPFPDIPLTVTHASSPDSKISVEWKPSGEVSITPTNNVGAINSIVVFSVRDATKSENRVVSATVHVSVTDRPAPPRLSPVTGAAQDSRVTISWTPGNSNGSSITEYEASGDFGTQSCGQVTQCSISGLTNGQTYTFKVRAKNAVGWSDYSNSVRTTPDTVPTSPRPDLGVEGIGGVQVAWKAPHNDGSPIDSYKVVAQCATASKQKIVAAASTSNSTTIAGLPHQPCAIAVFAKNAAGWSTPGETRSITPLGEPSTPQIAIASTSNGVIKGSINLDLQGQSFTGWKCTLDSQPCSISGGESTDFSIRVPASTWYTGGKVSLSVTASFAQTADKSAPTKLITMERLAVGSIKLSSVTRSSTGSITYTYSRLSGQSPSDTAVLKTQLRVGTCTLDPHSYAPDTAVTQQISAGCTGETAILDVYIEHTLMTSSAQHFVDSSASDPPNATPSAVRGRATNTQAPLNPQSFQNSLWSLVQNGARYSSTT